MSGSGSVTLDLARGGLVVSRVGSAVGGARHRFVRFADAHVLEADAALTWDRTAERAVANRRRIAAMAPAVLEQSRQLLEADPEVLRPTLPTHLSPVLDQHQVRNVAVMCVPGGWGTCLFDEQGTGKSLTLIAAFDALVESDEADVLLVVSPKTMVAEWQKEFERFTHDLYRVRLAVGGRAAKTAALSTGADVVVVNYDAVPGMLADLILLCRRSRVVLALDESFVVKNADTVRTAAVAQLREWCYRAFVLCGTPAPNSAHDLVTQFSIVDFGYTFGHRVLPRDRDDAAELARRTINTRSVYLRSTKTSVLPLLPDRTYSVVPVDMAPRQRLLYDRIAGELAEELAVASDDDFRRDYAHYFARREALLRVCSDPTPIVASYHELPAKLTAMDSLLRGYVADGEKVVVWSRYRATIRRIAERYADLGLVIVDGSVTDTADRREAIRAFQEDDSTRVFVGNPAAAGAGVTLHAARLAVYESLSGQAAHLLQSLDRIHRRGQERRVEYVVLLCRDSVEERQHAQLTAKAETQADLMGDPLSARPTRSAMLAELLPRQGDRDGSKL